jgi:hypothetical protein
MAAAVVGEEAVVGVEVEAAAVAEGEVGARSRPNNSAPRSGPSRISSTESPTSPETVA